MRITVDLNLRPDIAPADLLAWLSLGQSLDAGGSNSFFEEPPAAPPVSTETHAAPLDIKPPASHGYVETPPPALPPPAASEPAPKNSAERRGPGRPKKNAAAAEPAAPTGFEPPPGVVFAAPATQVPYPAENVQVAYPPGAFPPGIPAPSAAAAPVPAVAMPPVSPPAPSANGEMRLEDFKAEAHQIHTAASERGLTAAYPFNMIRSKTWPDGSAKEFVTMQMDSVPPHQRRKLLDACMSVLMQ